MPLPLTGPISYLDLSNEFGGTNASVGTAGPRSYTSPGVQTYTVPTGVTSLEVLVVGGGGGGAAGVVAVAYCAAKGGGGGGGGVVTYNPAVPVTPGETITITVGAGGAANGGVGGASSLAALSGTTGAGGGGGGTGQTGGAGAGGAGGSASGVGGVAGGGGGGACSSGGSTTSATGGNGGIGQTRYYPGQAIAAAFGAGGGGGGTTGSPGAGGGTGGAGGSNSIYSSIGTAGLGGGGGGGGGVAPYLNGSAGGSGGVYFYAAPALTGSIDIEDYYRGQGYVPDISQNSSVPFWTSGAHPGITVTTDFRNATNLFYFTYTVANGYYAQDLCILAAATAQGYQNDKPLVATVNVNGVLGASTVYTVGLDTGTGYTTLPTITVNVGATGVISGHGGGPLTCSGGLIFGGCGGSAVRLQVPTTVNNNGIIQAGGAASDVVYGVYAGGAGYGYGVGVQGNQGTVNQIGTLFSGGAPQGQQTGKKSSASSSYGGGWVSEAGQSPSTNGYPGAGSFVPGVAFANGNTNLTLAVHGTIRGTCGI